MGKELSDATLLRVMAEELGSVGAVRVLGWCVLYAAAGCTGLDDIIRSNVGTRSSRYRIASDIRRVRDRLARDGYELSEQVEDPEQLVRLAGYPGRRASV